MYWYYTEIHVTPNPTPAAPGVHTFTFRDVGPGWDEPQDVQEFRRRISEALREGYFSVMVHPEEG